MRGDQFFAGVPNQECNRIVESATDRLVFLSGKGERQTDIDFVIQPYREYFAALYLSSHTEADPDKVFVSLVERGPFWLNVLQFYVALARPAQQFAWIHRALESSQTKTGIDRSVIEVEYQRATLATLAEYVDLPQVHFQKGISVALPATNWWTWVGQEWAVPIVRSIRSGDAWREILRSANEMEHPNRTQILFILWLLPRVIRQTAPEYITLTAFVVRLLDIPAFREEAVATILLYDLPVNLSEAHEESLINVLSEYSFRRKLSTKAKYGLEFLKRLSRTSTLRLICSPAAHVGLEVLPDPWSYLELPVETQNKETLESFGEAITVGAPSWTRVSVANQEILRFSKSLGSDPYAKYFHALLDALRNPNDAYYDRYARRARGCAS